MKRKDSQLNLQSLAEFMRNVAYSDNMKHKINWSLSIIHPKTNDGDIGFSGGLWKRGEEDEFKSVSFGYSETKGIYNFKYWIGKNEICSSFGQTPNFEQFKKTVIRLFGVEKLFEY